MTDPQLRRFARQLVGLEERLHYLETVPQLAHSSIDDHGVPVYDKDGNLASIIGKQEDGTWGAPPLAGPAPGPPSGVSAVGGAGIVHVHWDGTFAEGTAPLDFDAVEVLVDGALAGAMPDRDGGSITIRADQGTRYISARVRTLVPRHSRTTSPFSVEVRAPAELLFDDTTARAEVLAQRIADAEQQLEAAEGRLLEAREALAALDTRVKTSSLQVSRGPLPPAGAPLGAQWLTPEGYLYVRVPCDEEVA